MVWFVRGEGPEEWYCLQWPVRGTFFRLQVYERVGISLVEGHEKLEISVKGPKGLTEIDIFLRDTLLG